MLETKGLCKTYKPKKGVPVLAIDHVSLRFPETGMVFLLGKSGSGKSTMLNLLGGLDQYDGGEIIIKGMSSKDFNQQRFDSYRNTYVGFIFQEYNVLEEFTVGANIALALELQGRKATDAELNAILHDVDLDGYGDRKPNELSGGQKQRVAIARALVKNPEIIMADEPTGALDSNTGRQVLDTLKKLSRKKLVIVVSHDREYAEKYADRIIELADGKVVRDVEATGEAIDAETTQQLIYRSNTVEIPGGYHLTEADREQINAYLDSLQSGGLTLAPQASQRQFQETDMSKIPVQDGSNFKLIQSRLPMRSAFKIGCSSLKHKRFRLVMTIILSVIAFGLFGMVDTFGSYDHIRACTQSLIDSDLDYISVAKALKMTDAITDYWSSYGHKLSEKDIETIEKESGIDVHGIFSEPDANLSFSGQYDPDVKLSEGEYNVNIRNFCGFAQITQSEMENMGYSLVAGKLPTGKANEIAISKAAYETFAKAGYTDESLKQQDAGKADSTIDDFGMVAKKGNGTLVDSVVKEPEQPKYTYTKISSEQDMIGKVLRLNGVDYTVCGIVDTKLDFSRYDALTVKNDQMSTADMVLAYMLSQELDCAVDCSLSGAAMLSPESMQAMVDASAKTFPGDQGALHLDNYSNDNSQSFYFYADGSYFTTLNNVPDADIVWVDGKKETLADDEVILGLKATQISSELGEYNEGSFVEEDEKLSEADAKKWVDSIGPLNGHLYQYYSSDYDNDKPMKIVGFVQHDSVYSTSQIVSDATCKLLVSDTEGVYDYAFGSMPKTEKEIETFVRYCYREDANVRYALQNAVTYELDTVDEVLKVVSKVFFYIGIGFAIFAALLMANFISTSISYKKQEIGILRAIGSRSNDVFRIFFSESFVIAMINFVFSAIICAAGVIVINYFVRTEGGILVTILHFGPRQIALLLLICIGIAALASFVPVMRIASKRPIDAIRNR